MENLFGEVIARARELQSEDIQIFPQSDHYQVLLRTATGIEEIMTLTDEIGLRLIRFLKYRSNMDTGERRIPQDGSFVYQEGEAPIELRLSSIANYRLEESLVIRLLYSQKDHKPFLEDLDPSSYRALSRAMQKQSGLIIFSGPVSSGKTTTMYELLRENYEKKRRSVITMEDPVEIKDDRFLQTQINRAAGVDYDQLIKASLRHHPDILLIGEIRDAQTARMTIRAALTGHLVLATIHAKDCVGVIGRLKELGITNEQLIQTLLIISSQRLVPCQNPHPSQHDRICLIEWMAGQTIASVVVHGQVPPSMTTLNQKLKEAREQDVISQRTFQEYYLEENYPLRNYQQLDQSAPS
ncbi:competence type IV pilus ATPase ComGA [Aerococcus sp. UMB7834]|uniref:competence type IV pilus ATPase ComGA n=1 Tax=Aerococcus sp. UMB7834 TaxID=3046342 RepID=UPI00254E0619|nr:competence type IV pilus ATPase ComGA [Aerococcus sp. UMB7834]MDK6805284.1 competence type IV pilus ATPase ComGA [Aerococcus sp. UMB7834]